MLALYLKELGNFFSSLIGYLTIAVFLILNGLLLWGLHSGFNILDYGFAEMSGFFFVSPYLFLLLIPAITMKMLAEEKRSGTIELLFTKPLSDFTIVFAKFLAGLTLVLLSLLPTLVYYVTIYSIAVPVGNVDSGAVFGSYIGLLLLAASFVAIGLFSSAITNNQIVSFIVAILLCLFCYQGFEVIYSSIRTLGDFDLLVKTLGIHHHYESVSRGVIDTRDALYFLSVIAIFLMLTYTVLQSRKWQK